MLSSCNFDRTVDKFDEKDEVKELACRMSSQVIESDVISLELPLMVPLVDREFFINGNTCCPLELRVRNLQLTSEEDDEEAEEEEDEKKDGDEEEEEEEDENDADDNDGVETGAFN